MFYHYGGGMGGRTDLRYVRSGGGGTGLAAEGLSADQRAIPVRDVGGVLLKSDGGVLCLHEGHVRRMHGFVILLAGDLMDDVCCPHERLVLLLVGRYHLDEFVIL